MTRAYSLTSWRQCPRTDTRGGQIGPRRQLSYAICRLRDDELLEAAHILPDGHPLGEPVIPNGLALCKLHHAAFDRYLIGVTPDLEVTVRLDVLEEIDGPMLQHGLQGFQGRRIHVPRADHLKPNRDFLAERYALFRRTSWPAVSFQAR
jgi:putative restriction endonuclease